MNNHGKDGCTAPDGTPAVPYRCTEPYCIATFEEPCMRSPAGKIMRSMEVPPMDYQERSEYSRLKYSDVDQGKRIAELLKENAALRDTIEFMRNYSGIEARACALCTYRDGVFISPCKMHVDMDVLRAEIESLNKVFASAVTMRTFPVPQEQHFELCGTVDGHMQWLHDQMPKDEANYAEDEHVPKRAPYWWRVNRERVREGDEYWVMDGKAVYGTSGYGAQPQGRVRVVRVTIDNSDGCPKPYYEILVRYINPKGFPDRLLSGPEIEHYLRGNGWEP